uniref:ubiquitin carboxyl-terminal hydrolase 7-like n=1 Tax=Styela clava TaxID=7725 RepID=UPI001939C52A|nr:ubiquitin carboxyl-terminal hydrolase 7-like [Styela clava]
MGQIESRPNLGRTSSKSENTNNKGLRLPVGLKFEGSTSYSNGLMQMVFFIPKLRNAVYIVANGKNADKKVSSMLEELFRKMDDSKGPDGEHKVRTDIHGLQEGERGVKLLTLSPILCLYSERYRKKFLEPYEFSKKLELDEFLDIPDPNDKATYVLHSLLIHRCKLDGENSDGNYHAFIDPKGDGNWFVFDHELVEKSAEEEMLREGFGGVIDGQLYRPYFFFYIRESKINEILLG